jgi:YYY domain-containing protein
MEYALVLLWFVAFQALALAALPLAARLFPNFPDRGAAFALPVALVVVTTVVFWVGHVGFGRWTAILGVVALVGLSAVVLWRDRSLLPRGNAGVRPHAHAETVVVFAVAFALLVAIRAIDPAISPGGGEKFLDFGIFKSLMRGDALPPQDMWWAGEHVLYYYGGHLMAAILSHLTDTAPRYAYNLALSGFYASLVTAAYGLGGAIADSRAASRRVGGTFAAFFVGFASNLVVPVTGLIWLLPDSTASGVANWVADALRDSEGNLAHAGELVQGGLSEFGYWAPSRVIPGTINEFPLFAFYNGDLHGHMLSTQFLLLVAALGFAYYRTPPENRRRRRLLAFGVLPVVVALLGLVNAWSLPTGLGVVWLALVFAPADPASLLPGLSRFGKETAVSDGGESVERTAPEAVIVGETRRIAAALTGAAGVGVLTVAWLSPFVVGILLQSAGNRSFDVLPELSSATALLLVHGAFLLVFGLYLWPRARDAFDVDPARFGLLAALVVLVAWVAGSPVLALVVPLLLLGWLVLRADGDAGYETVLLVAGAGLVTLVEFMYVEDGAISGRFNTVFKVYMQVWVLWGTAAGAMVAALLSDRAGPAEWSRSVGGFDATRADLMAVVVAALLVSTSLYGGLTMQSHFTSDGELVSPDDQTLDGLAYLDTYHPDEAEAIHWLDDREGQPHVVTAPGRPYDWYSPVPSLTGLPAVIGWVYQEGAYRGYDVAELREQDVDLIYTGTWSDRAENLRKHDVTYVYVGPVERETYPNADLNFAQYPGVERVFENDGVTIYRVDQSEL